MPNILMLVANFAAYRAEFLFENDEKELPLNILAKRFKSKFPMSVSSNRETYLALTSADYAQTIFKLSYHGIEIPFA